jgi:hypothetical protein
MSFRAAFAVLAVSATFAASGVACGSSSKQGFSDTDGGPGGGPGGSSSGAAGDGGTGSFSDDVVGSTPNLVAEVYGHSADTLYRLDPDTKAVTTVGPFTGCTSVIDIAIDGSSRLFGTTTSSLYSIDKATAKCTHIASGSYPNSLSFVPKGTVDQNVEALVGYEGSDYVRIDPSTGVKISIGALGVAGLASSGDIVSVKGGPTYLTVNGTGCSDCLVEVDPKTGAMTKNWGDVKHANVFGLAFWAGSVYGFDDVGDLFEVTIVSGKLTTTAIAIPGGGGAGLAFWGAGSTTSAPVVPTK